MKIGQYILSLDQGTTSSRAVLFDALGGIAGMGQREFTQIYPQPGYVEHDAVEILQTQLYAMRQAVHEAEITAEDIAEIAAFLVLRRTNAVIDEIEVHRANKAPFA